MQIKFLNALVVVTSLFGYLEWGSDQHSFLFQTEKEILVKLSTDPLSALHPFTVLPMLGQIFLVSTLFQKQPKRFLTVGGIACIGILLLLMFVIGILTLNFKILISTVPFILSSIFALRATLKKSRRTSLNN